MKKKAAKFALIVIGTGLILNAALMLMTSNLNAGIIAEFLLGAAIVVYGIFINGFMKKCRVYSKVCSGQASALLLCLLLSCSVSE